MKQIFFSLIRRNHHKSHIEKKSNMTVLTVYTSVAKAPWFVVAVFWTSPCEAAIVALTANTIGIKRAEIKE